jgi:hypothetical protein
VPAKDEQICIHTAQGMICYVNSNGASRKTKYTVSVHLLKKKQGKGPAPQTRGRAADEHLATGLPKLNALFEAADQLRRDDSEVGRAIKALKLNSWHTVTRKVS